MRPILFPTKIDRRCRCSSAVDSLPTQSHITLLSTCFSVRGFLTSGAFSLLGRFLFVCVCSALVHDSKCRIGRSLSAIHFFLNFAFFSHLPLFFDHPMLLPAPVLAAHDLCSLSFACTRPLRKPCVYAFFSPSSSSSFSLRYIPCCHEQSGKNCLGFFLTDGIAFLSIDHFF